VFAFLPAKSVLDEKRKKFDDSTNIGEQT